MLPYLTFWAFITVSSMLADFLISHGILSIGWTRKLMSVLGQCWLYSVFSDRFLLLRCDLFKSVRYRSEGTCVRTYELCEENIEMLNIYMEYMYIYIICIIYIYILYLQ